MRLFLGEYDYNLSLLKGDVTHKFVSMDQFLAKIFFVAYILLYPMYKLFFKFEIICLLHCHVMADFIKLPPYLHDLYSLL